MMRVQDLGGAVEINQRSMHASCKIKLQIENSGPLISVSLNNKRVGKIFVQIQYIYYAYSNCMLIRWNM